MAAARPPRDPVARVTFYLERARHALVHSAYHDLYSAMDPGLDRVADIPLAGTHSPTGYTATTDLARDWRKTLGLIEFDCRLILITAFEFDARLREARRRCSWSEAHEGKLGPVVLPDPRSKGES
jgi:hypothetical protein